MSGDAQTTPRPWPQEAWPTAAELADWLSRCTSAERVDFAEQTLITAQRGGSCFERNHDGRIEAAEAELSHRSDMVLHQQRRAEKAEAERDALRERIAALANTTIEGEVNGHTVPLPLVWASELRLILLQTGGAR